jgi:hypothetical protein
LHALVLNASVSHGGADAGVVAGVDADVVVDAAADVVVDAAADVVVDAAADVVVDQDADGDAGAMGLDAMDLDANVDQDRLEPGQYQYAQLAAQSYGHDGSHDNKHD